jgi:hypothetical protein
MRSWFALRLLTDRRDELSARRVQTGCTGCWPS